MVLRGLPVERWSIEQTAMAFLGIGAYFGKPVSQNGKGHILGHVKDLGRSVDDPSAAHLSDNAPADLPHGLGRHRRAVVSEDRKGRRIEQDRELDAALCRDGSPSPRSRGRVVRAVLLRSSRRSTSGQERLLRNADLPLVCGQSHGDVRQPLLHRIGAALPRGASSDETSRSRPSISSMRSPTTPPTISTSNSSQATSSSSTTTSSCTIEPITRIGPSAERKRHLLRLWLCPPNGRPLPPVFADRYGGTEIGNRGGIVLSGVTMTAPLEAC